MKLVEPSYEIIDGNSISVYVSVHIICNKIFMYKMLKYNSILDYYIIPIDFTKEMEFIIPYWLEDKAEILTDFKNSTKYNVFHKSCEKAEKIAKLLYKLDVNQQDLIDTLPNTLKTSIIYTTDLRSWEKILNTENTIISDSEILRITKPLAVDMSKKFPYFNKGED